MKISVSRPDPLSFSSHGEQPVGHLCRQFLSMGSTVVESLESPQREKQQLWWTRLGHDFSIDTFPPDDHPFSSPVSDSTKLSDFMQEEDNLIKPQPQPLPLLTPVEFNQQQSRLVQVNTSSFQARHTEFLQSIHREMDMVLEQSRDHIHVPADVDHSSSDGDFHPQATVLMSECHCEHQSAEEPSEAPTSARVKLMCSFGGRIMPRPIDGKLRYVGGETRIIMVFKGISFAEFISKMARFYGAPLGVKYQLPDEDLDALVSVSSDDDLQNMMEEYDKVGSCGSSASRLRLFFFSTPADVEVSEMKIEGEDGCPSPDQRYVDAINGISEKTYVNLLEDDTAGVRQVDGGNIVESNGRALPFEQANEMIQSKGPSPHSSSPSSPSFDSRQASYHKPPAVVDLALQNLNDHLSKATTAPHGFEGDVDQEGSGSSSSTPFHYHNDHYHYDQQFTLAADCPPRILHHDLTVSRGGENWPGLRHVDSQTKLVRQPEQHVEYRTNGGVPLEHWNDMQHARDTILPQVEHQRLIQQQKHSLLPQQQQQHHHHYHHHQQQQQQHHQQQQQGWYPQMDGSEHSHQDMHMQPQIVHQHHQPPHHLHHSVSVQDGSAWNAEHHTMSPFIHGSTQINPQLLHGLAPAPPYQMGSAPSSPRVGGYEYQGKCSCGLQHSQVHRGITVSIGEQPYSRRPPHFGDQAARKQGFRNSSRFYDNTSYGADSSMWQQASHSMLTAEAEHREHGSHWQLYHGRQPRDCQLADCQARGRAMQYCEPLVHSGEILPTLERPEMNKRCLCINCLDNRRMPVEMPAGHSAYPEVPDLGPEWFLHRKGFDSDGGRGSAARKVFPRIPTYKDEDQRGDFVDERHVEGESGLYVSQPPGNFESRRAMVSPVDGMHQGRKPPLPSVAVNSRFQVPDEPLVSQPSAQGASDWHPNLALSKTSMEVLNSWSMASLEPGNWPDVLPLQQGQMSNRVMEASKELPNVHLAVSTSVMLEETEVQHHTYGALASQSFCREENIIPGGVGGALGEALGQWSATSEIEFADEGCNCVKMSAAHGAAHLLSSDVIPLGPTASVSGVSQSGQAVPAPASIMSNTGQATVSPVYDQSPSSSIDVTNFSFAAGNTRLPLSEANTDSEPFISHMSATEKLADGLVSSLADCCSNVDISDANQEVAYKASQKALQDQSSIAGMEIDARMASLGLNSAKLSVIEHGKGSSFNDASTVNGCLEAIVKEESGVTEVVQIDASHQENNSQVEVLGMEEKKEPVVSEAEAEAIARGLQIIKNSDLEDLKELGSGTYGTVYHGKWRGSDVAIKRIRASCFTGPPSDRERLISDFWREACTLGQLHHPNVVAFYGVVPDGPGGTLATVTEYMVNGSLKQVLHKKDRTIDRRKRLLIAMDAAFGMEYLHSKNIVHFDLKCENLLVNMRDAHRPICKVGDFGLSKVKHRTLVSGGVRGTLPWMAPELLSGNSSMVSEKIDVFSFGIVMWELLTGEEPYANMLCGAIIGGIVNNTLRPSIPSWCDPGWRSLMEQCWSGNPADRPSFAEVARELRAIAATMNLK